MPEGDGADFYRAAVAQRKELAQHFLFMTGDTANEEAWRPVLAKPFHAVEQVSA
jgi:hypothetical protein